MSGRDIKPGAGLKKGRTQTMACVKVDNELMAHLRKQKNRNRYINDLIRADMERNAE